MTGDLDVYDGDVQEGIIIEQLARQVEEGYFDAE